MSDTLEQHERPRAICTPLRFTNYYYLEPSFELCAWLVHCLVSLHELDDEDGEVLVRPWADDDGHGADPGGTGQMNL